MYRAKLARHHFLVVLLCCVPDVASAAPAKRFQTIARGSIYTAGNTLGLSKAASDNSPGTQDSIGTFTCLDPSSIDDSPAGMSAWPTGTTNDWTQNGSEAILDFPFSDLPSTVLYAELVWGGSTFYGSEDVTDFLDTPVTLRYGNDTISVAPDSATAETLAETASSGFAVNYYLRSAEVTDFVAAHRGGAYAVEGVPATQDLSNNSLNAAGWTLVVVVRNLGAPERSMTVYVGGSFVDEDSTEQYLFEGFCAPGSGSVVGRSFVSALEGDADLTGDSLAVSDAPNGVFVALQGPNNPETNFFCSQINQRDGTLDTDGSFGTVNHDAFGGINAVGGRQGWDMTAVGLSSEDGTLAPGQQQVVLQAETLGDSFMPTTVSFEIDLNAPEFASNAVFSADHEIVYEGDEVELTLAVDNVGTADATDSSLTMSLPAGTSLLAFAIDGVPGDANQAPVDAADLAAGVAIGDVAAGDARTITMRIGIDALPAAPTPARFTFSPQWSYNYLNCAGDPPIAGNFGLAPLELRAPRLELELAAADLGGQRIRYTATATNSGEAATAGATFTMGIPSGGQYVSESTTLNGVALADVAGEGPYAVASAIQSASAAAGVVEISSDAVVVYEVQMSAGGSVLNTVEADPDGSEPAPPVEASVELELAGAGDGDGDGDGDADASSGDGDGDGDGDTSGGDGDGDEDASGGDGDGDGDASGGDGDGDEDTSGGAGDAATATAGDGDGDGDAEADASGAEADGGGDGDGDGDGDTGSDSQAEGEAEATGDDGSGSEGTGSGGTGSESGDAETGEASGFITAPAVDSGGGCDCKSGGERSGWGAWAALLLWARRRRRPAREMAAGGRSEPSAFNRADRELR